MSGTFPRDFGTPYSGASLLAATGTTQADAFQLGRSVNVFSTVPAGAGAVLPSAYSPGAQITVLNRGANALNLYPPLGDEIETSGVNTPVQIVPGGEATFVSFDAPLAPSPRVWWMRSSPNPTVGTITALTGNFVNLTATGTVTLPIPVLPNQSANVVFAGPSSGSAAAPAFRGLVSADIATALLTPGPIGSTTANTGAFTTLGVTGASTLGNGSANYLTIAGATTGNGPTITAAGSDTNINLVLAAKGTGAVTTGSGLLVAGATPTIAINNLVGYQAVPILNVFSSVAFSTTVSPTVKAALSFSGSVNSGQALFNSFSINTDTVDPTVSGGPGGATGWYFQHNFGGTAAAGGRTALSSWMRVTGASTQAVGAFLVGSAAVANAYASAGGASGAGNQRGNLFASNQVCGLVSGAGLYWNSVVGNEIDISTPTGTQAVYKIGQSIFLTFSDATAGTGAADSAIVLGVGANNSSSPGWQRGITFSHPSSWWAMSSTGTMIGTLTAYAGGPAFDAAYGIDFSAVTFSTAFLKSNGFLVDGSGNTTLLGLTAGGSVFAPISHSSYLQTSGGALTGQAFYDGVGAFGTVTSGQAFFREFAVNSDTMSATNGAAGLYIGHTVSAGAVGGRNALQILLNVAGAVTAGAEPFYVAIGPVAQASANAGGTNSVAAGSLFGSNPVAALQSGATYWDELVGEEVDVAAATGSSVLYKMGLQIVQTTLDAVAGTNQNNALQILNQPSASQAGWAVGLSFGGKNGVWAMQSGSTLIGTTSTSLGGPSYACATGIDFSAVTFSTGAFKSTGFLVDGSGNTTAATFVSATNNAIRLTSQTSGAASGAGTLSNAPSAGDPNFWLPVTINGTTRYVPAW